MQKKYIYTYIYIWKWDYFKKKNTQANYMSNSQCLSWDSPHIHISWSSGWEGKMNSERPQLTWPAGRNSTAPLRALSSKGCLPIFESQGSRLLPASVWEHRILSGWASCSYEVPGERKSGAISLLPSYTWIIKSLTIQIIWIFHIYVATFCFHLS